MWENLGFTVLGILIGGVVGHRLALGRDKRREFNDLARDVYVDLLDAKRAAEHGSTSFRIDFRAIEAARTSLSKRKKLALSKAIRDYRNLMSKGSEHVGGGAYEFRSELYPQLIHVLERLSSLLRPR